MKHHEKRPTAVWVLPPGFEVEPRKVPMEEIREIFHRYDDTGYEPDLEWLHKQLDCSVVDFRSINDIGHVWFDDEGLFKEDPKINYLATFLYQQVYDRANVIVGNAVLVVDPNIPEEDADNYVCSTLEVLRDVNAKVRA